MKRYLLLIVFVFLSSLCYLCKAVNYTWNGSTSNSWTNSANWTPAGVPGNFDNVTVNGGAAFYPLLNSSLSINNLVINTGGFFDIGSYTFTPTGSSFITGAVLIGTGGYLKLNGGTSSVSGSTIQCRMRISCSTYTLSNSVFQKFFLLQKAGAGVTNSTGNIFNDTLWVESNGTGALRFGVSSADTYNAIVILKNLSTGDISMGYNSSGNIFNGSVEVNSATGGNINFGIGGGTSQLYPGFKLYEGSDGFVRGWLEIRNFAQFGATTQALDLTWTGAASATALGLRIGPGATFNGSVGFYASNIFLNGATYNGVTSTFQKTSAGGSNASEGGNTFNSATTNIENTTSSLMRMANTNPDIYNTAVHFYRGIGTSQMEIAYNGSNSFTGDIYIDCGAATSTNVIAFGGGTGIVLVNGTAPQAIYRPLPARIPAPSIQRLTINKSSGNLTLNTAVTVFAGMILLNGIVNTTATYSLLISNGASCTLGNSSSYIDGPMNYTYAGTLASGLNFPIGKNGSYRPAIVSVTHNDATPVMYTAELINISANALGYSMPSTLSHVSFMRYWQIDRESIPNLSAAEVTLFYDADDGVPDPSFLSVAKTTGAATAWTDLGGAGSSAVSGSITSGSFSTFSKFTLGNKTGGTNPLPIELISFDALPFNHEVLLTWQTASEKNNNYFTVEKTTDGVAFEEVAKVKGNGTTSALRNYSTTDKQPYGGVSYYRLKQTDNDGVCKAFKLVVVELPGNSEVKIYPNPSAGNFEISCEGEIFDEMEIRNEEGKVVYRNAIYNSQGKNTIRIDQEKKLSSGVYTLVLKSKTRMKVLKIIVE